MSEQQPLSVGSGTSPPQRVIVVGGGLSGTTAALRAKAVGATVELWSRGRGRTAWMSGLFAVAEPDGEYRIAPAATPEGIVDGAGGIPHLRADLGRLLRRRPDHPFALSGAREGLGEALSRGSFADRDAGAVVGRLATEIEGAFVGLGELLGLNLRPSDRPRLFANDLGGFTSARVAPWALPLRADASPPVVVDLGEIPGFRAGFLARSWAASLGAGADTDQVGKMAGEKGWPVISLAWNREPVAHPAVLAARLDDEATIDRLIDDLRPRLAALPSSALPQGLLFPAILGLQRLDVAARLSEALHLPVGECVPHRDSVPGLRLVERLDATLARAEIPVHRADWRPPTADTGPEGACAVVILATGKYAGGGVASEGHGSTWRLVEPLFDAPVVIDGRAAADWSYEDRTAADFFAHQPIMRAGVAVAGDASVREGGAVFHVRSPGIAEPVFACGQILAGFDPFADGCAEAVDIVTGFRAGQEAAQRAIALSTHEMSSKGGNR